MSASVGNGILYTPCNHALQARHVESCNIWNYSTLLRCSDKRNLAQTVNKRNSHDVSSEVPSVSGYLFPCCPDSAPPHCLYRGQASAEQRHE